MKHPLILLPFILLACTQTATTPTGPPHLLLLLTDTHPQALPYPRLGLSISEIWIHGSNGWQTLTQNARRYNLLQIRDETVPLLNTTLLAEEYDQVKLYVSQATITPKRNSQPLYLPSKEITFPIQLPAKNGNTYEVLLDLDTLKSIYATRDQHYVFAPRFRLSVYENNERLLQQTQLGMDEHGRTEENLSIPPEVELRVIHEKIRATRPLLREATAGINLYLQSANPHSPLQFTLTEIRLQGRDQRVTLYAGEQTLALDNSHVQKIASQQIPPDLYTQAKLYFHDQAFTPNGDALDVPPYVLVTLNEQAVQEDQTLYLLLHVPVSIEKNRIQFSETQPQNQTEPPLHVDVDSVGQRIYAPYADLDTVRKADREGMFQP